MAWTVKQVQFLEEPGGQTAVLRLRDSIEQWTVRDDTKDQGDSLVLSDGDGPLLMYYSENSEQMI